MKIFLSFIFILISFGSKGQLLTFKLLKNFTSQTLDYCENYFLQNGWSVNDEADTTRSIEIKEFSKTTKEYHLIRFTKIASNFISVTYYTTDMKEYLGIKNGAKTDGLKFIKTFKKNGLVYSYYSDKIYHVRFSTTNYEDKVSGIKKNDCEVTFMLLIDE